MYYPINEALAKQAQQANSFRDYIPGSATQEYRKEVDAAAEIATKQKESVSEFYRAKIDGLLESYSRRLADWYNAYNRNRASCPSIMIAGGSNFPVGKKQRQNSREQTLMAEYEEISKLVDRIKSTGTGAVDLADPHAREILEDQLTRQLEYQADAKKINAYFRKHKTVIGCPNLSETEAQKMQAEFEKMNSNFCLHNVPFPSYELASIRGKIKRLRERLQDLDALESVKAGDCSEPFAGGEVIKNAELNRLQIVFEEKPAPYMIQLLKLNGFRWAPSQGAWQRQLTANAIAAANLVLKGLK